jgi:hypothetical protein
VFTATPVNAGSNPYYVWKRNNQVAAITSSNVFADSLTSNGDLIYCILYSNRPCGLIDSVISNPITITVLPSDTTTVVARPQVQPGSGTYSDPIQVTLTCSTPNAQIYYSLTGNMPVPGTTFTRLYTGPITILQNTTLRAIGVRSGIPSSPVVVAQYIITNPGIAATPVITPGTGSYAGLQTVQMSSTTSGTSLYYTTNGNTPVVGGNTFTKLYTGPFQINATTTIKAIAVKSGILNSPVAVSVVTITSPSAVVATPVITPGTGSVSGPQSVSIVCATPGATIYYTTSGNVPVLGTTFTRVYSAPFQISTSATIRALATAPGLVNSAVAVSFITIGPAREAFEAETVGPVSFHLFPNPCQDNLEVTWTASDEAPLFRVLDVLGRALNLEFNQNPGENRATWRVGQLPSGLYRLEIRTATHREIRNFRKD